MMTRRTPYLSVCLCIGLLAATPPAFAWSVTSLIHKVEHYFHDIGGYIQKSTRGGAQFPERYARPNPRFTPGAVNPAVTQASLYETICRPGGYTRSIRPPEEYTEKLKREQIRQYGYRDHRLGAYEEDHLVPLGLGGSPYSPRNLWPEPHDVEGGWGSYAKDKLEDQLHGMVCSNKISLATAQYAIANDWIAAYKRYLSPAP